MPDLNVTPEPSLGERTDESLVRLYRAGDEGAATSLYLRYAGRLRALARTHCGGAFAGRFDADDIVQSVFKTFFDGVRRESYEVPAGGEIWGLLLVLALNKIRSKMEYHGAAKRSVHLTASSAAIDREAVLHRDEAAAAFLKLIVDELLDGLPVSNRAIVQHRIEGYEIGEIAARTGRSRRTVERVLQEFRTKLAQH
jgi:RNA polymerase sigma-70 factor (ECF subfamily)